MLLLVTTGDAQHRWWLCCWGHVFEHDPVPEGDQLQCPAFFDDDERCGTFFFLPRRERLEDNRGITPQAARARVRVQGDPGLADQVLEIVSIIW
jgi:hypothetical protein